MAIDTNAERKTLTIQEVARILGVGRDQAYNAAKSGDIPSIRIGRRILVPRKAFERMLEEAGA